VLRDIAIVGAGPVGATLALALRDADLDVVAFDARPRGTVVRSDRSLALSHGARLIFERLNIWSEVAAVAHAVTAITTIDISQRGGFGTARLSSEEHGIPALGYVVSYRALQAALDVALSRSKIRVEHGVSVEQVGSTPAYAFVDGERDGARLECTSRVAAIADGGGEVVKMPRHRHDYGQVAIVAKVWTADAHAGLAYERFTCDGPLALLPEHDHYGLVWTTSPQHATSLMALTDAAFLAALATHFASRAVTFLRVDDRRMFPLTLDVATRVTGERVVLLGNAAQALHPVAGQGFNLGVRDAYELAQELLDASRDQIGAQASLDAYARRRRADRWSGIAFTHALLSVFGSDRSLMRWPRGLALNLLDTLPPAKRAFTHVMLHGLR
jgi:2-octaprenyl-6-methoxyphenol hydroxylase